MTRAVEIGSLIDRDPAIRGGRPKIAGTGVTVMRVAAWYKMGLSPEEIATEYGYLNLAQVHAALAYHHANAGEIEADVAEEEAFAEKVYREAKSRSPR
ncbi:MAG: DUF433 domain-containing protein [Bryobacteraceae bacterium]